MQWATPSEAIRLLRAGMRIFVGSASGTPNDLLAALADSGIEDVELFYFVLGDFDIEAMLARAPLVKHRPLYVGRALARSLLGDRVSYVPISLPQAAKSVCDGRWHFDAVLVATSEPDAHGYVSLGAALGMTPAVLASSCLAIAECVSAMPFTLGGAAVPLARFAATIQASHAPVSYSHPHNDDTGRRIGRYLSRLVEDGATLQTGPGAVANGALRYLAHKRHLRIHSDMVYDDAQVLIDAGALDANSAPAITTSHATAIPIFCAASTEIRCMNFAGLRTSSTLADSPRFQSWCRSRRRLQSTCPARPAATASAMRFLEGSRASRSSCARPRATRAARRCFACARSALMVVRTSETCCGRENP